jgi:NosR/NirI family nitrous oxide reductase transcriptional regulator
MIKLPRNLIPILALVSVAILLDVIPINTGGSFVSVATAGTAIPIPDFTTYEIPDTEHPDSRLSAAREYADLAALVVGILLASLFALRFRSRRALLILAVVSLAWLGFWREGCVCAIGAIQNVALAIADPDYAIPTVVLAFFMVPLVSTLFFGRTFCAAVCPLGAIQELVALWPIRVPKWLDHALGLLAYIYLGLAVAMAATGTAFLICRYDPFVAFFRLSGDTNMLIFGGCFLLLGVFVCRPYCRYVCPYGALLGLLSKVSMWHVKIPPTDCINCRLCEDSCPYGAIEEPTVDQAAEKRPGARRRLVVLLLLLPVLVGAGAWIGTFCESPLGRLDPTIRLAQEVHIDAMLDDNLADEEISDTLDAFQDTGVSVEKLYTDARARSAVLRIAGGWLGAWVGLVLGIKLIHLSIRRKRTDYQPVRANCVSCGRCFWYCPNETETTRLVPLQPIDMKTTREET